jgi:ferredoxin-type protein NapH
VKRQKIRFTVLFISLLLFPVTIFYFSPMLIIMGALSGIITASFIVFAAQFMFSLIFGRAFCGWLCPAGGIQEACFRANSRPIGGLRWSKYVIWVPWMAGIILAFTVAGGFKAVVPLFEMPSGISVADPYAYIIFYSVTGLIVILALALGRRAFCHYACWMAPFMIIGSKIREKAGWPALRLAADGEKCIQCGRCVKNCPMSLDTMGMASAEATEHTDCILCGECIDVCPKGVLSYAWGTKRP